MHGKASAIRAGNLWRKYRLRPDEYDALREQQGYRCAICGTHEDDIPPSRTGRPRITGEPPAESFRLVVDHCHATNRVRGLLCTGCNTAIGHAKDSPETLRAAARYLDTAQELGSVAS
ncbi:endonuclease VII domain-containing protein [Micromonospora rifamycinica]|uniref:endonuclease VII domain-containing protein n=1 Tax=Micromonospora rifamycinica TaxID=291594 RepID=UPI002E2D37FC|nr:endonuclease VII domain-containing protein [Micromonospora rifamycinica]